MRGQFSFLIFNLGCFLQENKRMSFTNRITLKTKQRILLKIFDKLKGLSLLEKLSSDLLSRCVFRLRKPAVPSKIKTMKMRLFSRAKYWEFEKKENKLKAPFIKILKGFVHHFLVYSIVLLMVLQEIQANCGGRFVNPLTDICWSCLFPMTIGGINVSGPGFEDTPNPSGFVCMCPRPPLNLPTPGIPVSFWEPARLVDVTRTPYCLINMGGIQMAGGNRMQGRGSVSDKSHSGGLKRSFYQVHWYVYPVIYWLELLTDFACLERASFDVAYLTELDPLWNDEETGFILNPEAVLFGNTIAQAACAVDCGLASVGFPNDALFWCGGCQGSLYPFSGTISAHVGGVQASLLATQRMMAKLHRELLLHGYMGSAGQCTKYPMPIIKKTQYKTQMVYPIPSTARGGCHPLGRSETLWASGREFPYQGEDFGYLIWRKRNCCVL